MIPGELVITLKDCHIYLAGYTPEGKVDWSVGHMKAVNEQLGREPLAGPKLWLNPEVTDIDGFKMDDIKLIDYHHHEPIRAKLL
jgi:thymidylate synthase